METLFNGNFGLFEVDKVIRKNNFYELRFKEDKRRFAGVHLQCFLNEDGIPLQLTDLESGNKIWIDISAYTADQSLFVYNPFGTKGRYKRA